MRFVWAVLAFVLAAVLIGAGIAQRTVFIGEKSTQAVIEVDAKQRYTLVDGSVFNSMPGLQSLIVRGDATVFASYGRTLDMQAWLADVDHNVVTMADDEIVSSVVRGVEPAAEPPAGESDPTAEADPNAEVDPTAEATTEADPTDGATAAGRNPAGSDLWLDEFSAENSLIEKLRIPSDVSVLIASDGTAAAPSDISLSWPVSNATPWAGPLMVLGSVLAAVGVLLYVLGFRNLRRRKGPLRRGLPPLPVTEPISLEDGAEKGVVSTSSRRGRPGGRRRMIVPVIAIGAIALSGCSPEAWPQFPADTPSPSPSTTLVVSENQQSPAVTQTQAERILSRIAEVTTQADADMNADLAATRLSGPLLDARRTNYTLRAGGSDVSAPVAVPTKPYEILLPQAFDEWPRSVLALWRDPAQATVPPRIMVLTQDDPWSDYRLSQMAEMTAAAKLPGLAPTDIGAPLVPPESPFLKLQPEQVAKAYADVIDKGADSEYAPLFDVENEPFIAQVRATREASLAKFNETASGETGSITFAAQAGTSAPVSIATLEAGAIVAVTVDESEVVKPTNERAVIRLTDNPTAQLLTGLTESAKGFKTIYRDQLFFFIPGKATDEHIRLLAYGSDLITTEELSE